MDSASLSWWIWVLLGLLLLAGEILTPGGFYIIFFGFGALVVGVLSLLGLHLGLAMEGLVFTVVSVAACAVFRKPLLARFRRLTPEYTVDTLIGETAITQTEIACGGTGKAELRGTAWNAQNLTDATIPMGQRCRVERVEGLTLFVRPL